MDIESLAKTIARLHGGKMLYRHEGKTYTVAGSRGYDSGWHWEVDRYAEAHWKEYKQAAEAVLGVAARAVCQNCRSEEERFKSGDRWFHRWTVPGHGEVHAECIAEGIWNLAEGKQEELHPPR